ncbi:MAG: hypothetical protein HY774_20125 [Acidobacteria bacterium]|nr:hypothetical protein [Acidobacteriota bacterium]
MPYVTSWERMGTQKGLEQGLEQGRLKAGRESVLDILEERFGSIPPDVLARIDQINDYSKLKQLHKSAITIASIEAFQNLLKE